MKERFAILASLLLLLALAPALKVEAAVRVELDLSRETINFPSADPDDYPSVAAAENPISVRVRVTGNPWGNWRLTVLAGGDLVSGSNTIPISNVTWTAQPLPFVDGRLDKATPQVVASGTGNANSTGSLRFFFKNSWNYATGNYSQVIVFTLTAP
jgi:hypothetical protein